MAPKKKSDRPDKQRGEQDNEEIVAELPEGSVYGVDTKDFLTPWPAEPSVNPKGDTDLVRNPSLVYVDDCEDDKKTVNLRASPLHRTVEELIIGGRYRVIDAIGSGGMGQVFKALDKKFRKPRNVAIKVLNLDLSRDEEHRERFEREMDVLVGLGNEHIVDIYDRGILEAGGRLYFVMEYLRGIDLADALKDNLKNNFKPFEWERTKAIALQICSAMQEAHDAGIVHRDLKPENIFLVKGKSRPDFVKIIDFGIAKDMGTSSNRLTQPNTLCGTPAFMSPEQAMGEVVDHRSDIYALGMIMYELLTGETPFNLNENTPLIHVLNTHVTKIPKAPREINLEADVNDKIEAIILKCLEKDPNKRFQSMEELEQAIRRVRIHKTEKLKIPTSEDPKILIVDDEDDLRTVLKSLLTQVGYDVSAAENGKKALEILATKKFRLMIIDIIMPGMNGFELARRIPKDTRKKMKFLFLSAHHDVPETEEELNRLVTEKILPPFLTVNKPFNNVDIMTTIAEFLDEKEDAPVLT